MVTRWITRWWSPKSQQNLAKLLSKPLVGKTSGRSTDPVAQVLES